MLQKGMRDPWLAMQWIVRKVYNAYQLWMLRRTAELGSGVCLAVHAEWTNRRREQLQIGKKVILGDVVFHIHDKGRLTIGDYTAISGMRVEAAIGVDIGTCCQISYNVNIHDNNGHPIDPERRKAQVMRVHEKGMDLSSVYESEMEPVTIGDNVWIGHDVTIMKGVTIGDSAIIATGSVVTKDVPPNSVAAGNPARVVKEIGQG